MVQNNVTRFLQAKKIVFEQFEISEEKKSADEVAEILNVPINQMFKTIVLKPILPGKPILAITPADKTADLKLIAKFIHEKKIEFPSPQEAEKITGLQTGGISPLALLNKGFRILLDNSALEMDWMHISGGQRGLNIRLKVQDFIQVTNCKITNISREPEE